MAQNRTCEQGHSGDDGVICWGRPSQGARQRLEGRVGSSQVVQEVAFELHLSDMIRG